MINEKSVSIRDSRNGKYGPRDTAHVSIEGVKLTGFAYDSHISVVNQSEQLEEQLERANETNAALHRDLSDYARQISTLRDARDRNANLCMLEFDRAKKAEASVIGWTSAHGEMVRRAEKAEYELSNLRTLVRDLLKAREDLQPGFRVASAAQLALGKAVA